FGIYDKLALQLGTVVLLAAVAAVLGVLAARRLWIGLAGIGAFTAIGLAAALTRAGAEPSWALPAVLGGIASGLTLWVLLRLGGNVELTPGRMADRTRRQFVGAAGAALGGAALLGLVGRQFAQKSQVNSAREGVALPTPSGARAVAPA